MLLLLILFFWPRLEVAAGAWGILAFGDGMASVAGMTLGTVVVEANLTSGALITANFANEYGRQVFAVPGRIDSPRSKGCHDLIKKGAKLCEGAEDILSEFEYLFPPSNKPASPADDATLIDQFAA